MGDRTPWLIVLGLNLDRVTVLAGISDPEQHEEFVVELERLLSKPFEVRTG